MFLMPLMCFLTQDNHFCDIMLDEHTRLKMDFMFGSETLRATVSLKCKCDLYFECVCERACALRCIHIYL